MTLADSELSKTEAAQAITPRGPLTHPGRKSQKRLLPVSKIFLPPAGQSFVSLARNALVVAKDRLDSVRHAFLHQEKKVDAAVLQAMGDLGNAWMTDDNLTLPQRVLCYRLASLDSKSPWEDGLLLKLARSTNDDNELESNIMELLARPWKTDPIRIKTLKELGSEPSVEQSNPDESGSPSLSGVHSLMSAPLPMPPIRYLHLGSLDVPSPFISVI